MAGPILEKFKKMQGGIVALHFENTLRLFNNELILKLSFFINMGVPFRRRLQGFRLVY
jgi:hypothetical protein